MVAPQAIGGMCAGRCWRVTGMVPECLGESTHDSCLPGAAHVARGQLRESAGTVGQGKGRTASATLRRSSERPSGRTAGGANSGVPLRPPV